MDIGVGVSMSPGRSTCCLISLATWVPSSPGSPWSGRDLLDTVDQESRTSRILSISNKSVIRAMRDSAVEPGQFSCGSRAPPWRSLIMDSMAHAVLVSLVIGRRCQEGWAGLTYLPKSSTAFLQGPLKPSISSPWITLFNMWHVLAQYLASSTSPSSFIISFWCVTNKWCRERE